MTDTLALRLRAAMAGPPRIKQVQLADACGIKPPSVSDWLNGRTVNIEGENLLAAAKLLNVRPEWLASGRGPMRPGPAGNVEPAPRPTGMAPLISRVQAGEFCEAIDLLQPGDAEMWIPKMHHHGPRTYCLRVQGDSMTNPIPGQKTYPEGVIVYVDPDAEVLPGKAVTPPFELAKYASQILP